MSQIIYFCTTTNTWQCISLFSLRSTRKCSYNCNENEWKFVGFCPSNMKCVGGKTWLAGCGCNGVGLTSGKEFPTSGQLRRRHGWFSFKVFLVGGWSKKKQKTKLELVSWRCSQKNISLVSSPLTVSLTLCSTSPKTLVITSLNTPGPQS